MRRLSGLLAFLFVFSAPALAYTPGPNVYYASQAGTTEAGLLAADAYCAAKSITCILDQSYTLGADRTLAAQWVNQGGKITTGTHNLTFSSGFSAPPNMVSFDSSGSGQITLPGRSPVYAGWFGTFGTSNDTSSFNRWVATASASNAAAIGNLGLVATVTSGVTIPPSIPFNFNGMEVTPSSSMTSGCVVTIDGSQPGYTGAYRGNVDNLRVFRTLIGSGPAHADPSSNVDGVCLGSTNGAYNFSIGNLRVEGFRDGLAINGPNVYIVDIHDSIFANNWRRAAAFYATSNSGENITFHHDAFANTSNTSFNGAGLYIDPATTSGEFLISDSSFDYNDVCIENHVGPISISNSHFESNNNNPCVELIKTSARNTPDLVLQAGAMGPGPGLVTWTGIPAESATGRPAYITTASAANVTINGTKFGTFNTTDQVSEIVKVTSGSPRRLDIHPVMDAATGSGQSLPLPISYYLNGMNISTTDLSTWTLNGSSGTTQTFDSSTVYSPDVGARKVVSTSGNSSSFAYKWLIPVKAGRTIDVAAYINCPTFTAGGYLAIQIRFYAQDGTTQVGSTVESAHITAATSGWAPAKIYTQVPNGATYAAFYDYTNLFTGTAYYSNEHEWDW